MPFPPVQGNLNCHYVKKFNEQQRLQFYPFNVSDTIKLVSFRYHANSYPIHKDSLLIDSLIETKILTNDQVNKLTDIMYNNFFKKQPNYDVTSLCFLPRNAILFVDKNGKLKEHIGICFHCDNYTKSSEEIKMGDDCDQKMEKLRKFFIAAGIKFGTDNTIDSYAGETLTD